MFGVAAWPDFCQARQTPRFLCGKWYRIAALCGEPCAALNQLRAEGFDVREEDVACLSPLGFEHINILGRYAFTLPDAVARGELRSLRNPAAHGTDADEPALT